MTSILEFAFIPYQGLTIFLFRTDPYIDLKLTCEMTIRHPENTFIIYFIRMSFSWLKLDAIDKNILRSVLRHLTKLSDLLFNIPSYSVFFFETQFFFDNEFHRKFPFVFWYL